MVREAVLGGQLAREGLAQRGHALVGAVLVCRGGGEELSAALEGHLGWLPVHDALGEAEDVAGRTGNHGLREDDDGVVRRRDAPRKGRGRLDPAHGPRVPHVPGDDSGDERLYCAPADRGHIAA